MPLPLVLYRYWRKFVNRVAMVSCRLFVPARNFMAVVSASLKWASKVCVKAVSLNVAQVPAPAHVRLAFV